MVSNRCIDVLANYSHNTSGGDPNIPNNDGTLPVQLAASFGEENHMI